MIDTNKIFTLRKKSEKLDGYCFTMDIDWASDIVIEYAVKFFLEKNIPIKIFLTHSNSYIQELIKNKKISYGIHPNFIQPSSQGKTNNEIIKYCMSLFPEAKSFRAHRWYADNDIYTELYRCGIKYESNLCSFCNVVKPYLHRSGMISFPVFLEDGAYLYHGLELNFNNNAKLFSQNGIKIINIHPMHLALNTPYFQYMRNIKDSVSREKWNNFNEDDISRYENTASLGIRDFLIDLINFINKKEYKLYSMEKMYDFINDGDVI